MFIDKGLPYEYALLIVFGGVTFLFVADITYLFMKKGIISFKGLRKLLKKIFSRPASLFKKFLNKLPKFFKLSVRKVLAVIGKINISLEGYRLAIINLVFIIPLLLLFYDMNTSPGIIWHYPSLEGYLDNYDKPIVVEFDRPFDPGVVQPYIFPEIAGEWKAEPVYTQLPFIKRRLVFYPHESMFPGKVFIYYAGITDVFNLTERWEYGIDANAVPLPNLQSMFPEDGTTDFAVDGKLEVEFETETGPFVDWQLELSPETKFDIESNNSKKLVIAFPDRLLQNTEYTMSLYRTPVRFKLDTLEEIDRGSKELIKQAKFTTVKAPLFSSVEPSGEGILIDQVIKVVFDQAMDQDSVIKAFSIEPAVEGTFGWADDKTLVFTPSQPLEKDKDYKIKFAQGIRSVVGGFTENPFEQLFHTIGPVKVSSFNPGGGAGGIGTGSSIRVTFNQEVDHGSAQSKFSLSPGVGGNFSWEGNTLVFKPSGLSYDTTYTVTISSGVKTVKGLDSNQNFSTTFRTASQVFTLNVPVYYQSWRYSCNLVASRMALAYRGVYRSVGDLYNAVAKDTTPWNEAANTWGNPYSGFVGDVTGASKGYGVYWGPISNMIQSQGRGTAVRSGWNRRDLLGEVQNGNPVIIWAHNGYSYAGNNISWTTPGGTPIYAVSGMHSYVVVGWKGSIDNPTHIILNDSNRGRWTISTGYFDALWNVFNRSGVVVY